MSDNQSNQNQPEEEPKKKMTAGNVVLLIFGIILILGGSFYLYKTFSAPAAPSVSSSDSSNLARGVLDASNTAQDIDIMKGFSYYF